MRIEVGYACTMNRPISASDDFCTFLRLRPSNQIKTLVKVRLYLQRWERALDLLSPTARVRSPRLNIMPPMYSAQCTVYSMPDAPLCRAFRFVHITNVRLRLVSSCLCVRTKNRMVMVMVFLHPNSVECVFLRSLHVLHTHANVLHTTFHLRWKLGWLAYAFPGFSSVSMCQTT